MIIRCLKLRRPHVGGSPDQGGPVCRREADCWHDDIITPGHANPRRWILEITPNTRDRNMRSNWKSESNHCQLSEYVAKKRARNFMFACPEEEAMHSESLTQKRYKEQTRKSPSTHAKKMRSLHRKPMKYMRLQGTALSLRQHYVTCQREAQALQHMTKVGLRLERPRGTS